MQLLQSAAALRERTAQRTSALALARRLVPPDGRDGLGLNHEYRRSNRISCITLEPSPPPFSCRWRRPQAAFSPPSPPPPGGCPTAFLKSRLMICFCLQNHRAAWARPGPAGRGRAYSPASSAARDISRSRVEIVEKRLKPKTGAGFETYPQAHSW
jgi:hypothetical protein